MKFSPISDTGRFIEGSRNTLKSTLYYCSWEEALNHIFLCLTEHLFCVDSISREVLKQTFAVGNTATT